MFRLVPSPTPAPTPLVLEPVLTPTCTHVACNCTTAPVTVDEPGPAANLGTTLPATQDDAEQGATSEPVISLGGRQTHVQSGGDRTYVVILASVAAAAVLAFACWCWYGHKCTHPKHDDADTTRNRATSLRCLCLPVP